LLEHFGSVGGLSLAPAKPFRTGRAHDPGEVDVIVVLSGLDTPLLRGSIVWRGGITAAHA
jgi:hypothetical protein